MKGHIPEYLSLQTEKLMSQRSLSVSPEHINFVKSAVRVAGYATQQILADRLGISLSTVSNYLNGRPVDMLNFIEISNSLKLDYKQFSELSENSNNISSQEKKVIYPYYVERPPIESDCLKEINKPGSLLRIIATKRMGKTVLIDRLLINSDKNNVKSIKLDFRSIEQHIFENTENFFQWFCAILTRKLNLKNEIKKYWDEYIGAPQNCSLYFEDYILDKVKSHILIALDDIDYLFNYPKVSEYFFQMLRTWHEDAVINQKFQRIHLIISYATEKSVILLKEIDINKSPFYAGKEVKLPEFNTEQMQDLALKRGLSLGNYEICEIQKIVGGHPYLVQSAISSILKKEITLEELIETSATESGIYANHLRSIVDMLNEQIEDYPNLKEIIRKVINNEISGKYTTLNIQDTSYLESLGLIKLVDKNQVKISVPIYRDFLKDRWNN